MKIRRIATNHFVHKMLIYCKDRVTGEIWETMVRMQNEVSIDVRFIGHFINIAVVEDIRRNYETRNQ